MICFIEKLPAALAGTSRRKNESKKSGKVARCCRFFCCTYKLPGRSDSLCSGENGGAFSSSTGDPAGPGIGQEVFDGSGICRRPGRKTGAHGNGKGWRVRYTGDCADVPRGDQYFKIGSWDKERKRRITYGLPDRI